jgi:hypothetical protein
MHVLKIQQAGGGCSNRQCMYIHPTAAWTINHTVLSRLLHSTCLLFMYVYFAPASQTARHVLPYVSQPLHTYQLHLRVRHTPVRPAIYGWM